MSDIPPPLKELKEFHRDGKTLKFLGYSDIKNNLHGTSYFWNENGKLIHIDNHFHGIQNGALEEYYSNGRLNFRSNFSNGHRNGFQEGWFENGQPSYRYCISDGFICGIDQEWDFDGILSETYYIEGQKKVTRDELTGHLLELTTQISEKLNIDKKSFGDIIIEYLGYPTKL